ncbi:hypothetical protein POVWA2_002540 [Plasmodium ovale wallikeri]|uniref:Uncharacterized protein n=1 Tax=Plasmodium ovale wallikeri TaxID=864142 RepID=A0A1A8YHW2_PLAOA|nr:hypothetical protein POVWA2_002540 [Plasmodium ovale wallikeri]SBT57177.1 hypothetical protein POVWA1_080550 [Plasmodium ovale wallikeri]
MFLFNIEVFLFTLSAWISQNSNHGIFGKAGDLQSVQNEVGLKSGRLLSEYNPYNEEEYDYIMSDDEDSNTLYSDEEEFGGYLKSYLNSKVEENGRKQKKIRLNDLAASTDSLDTIKGKKKILKEILDYVKKYDNLDFEELKAYIDANIQGEQGEKLKMLVDELKKYKVKYIYMKSNFSYKIKKLRKKMKNNIRLIFMIVPSLTALALLLWFIVSLIFPPAAPVAAIAAPYAAGAGAGAGAASVTVTTAAGTLASGPAAAAAASYAASEILVPTGVYCCSGGACKLIYAALPQLFF